MLCPCAVSLVVNICMVIRSPFSKLTIICLICAFGWLVVLGFNDPLRQYFSLYRAISQREGERGEKG